MSPTAITVPRVNHVCATASALTVGMAYARKRARPAKKSPLPRNGGVKAYASFAGRAKPLAEALTRPCGCHTAFGARNRTRLRSPHRVLRLDRGPSGIDKQIRALGLPVLDGSPASAGRVQTVDHDLQTGVPPTERRPWIVREKSPQQRLSSGTCKRNLWRPSTKVTLRIDPREPTRWARSGSTFPRRPSPEGF